ncbi:MAG: 5'(3')-deoxyribonucleotidase [Phycisphaerales bacterium]|nr:5'(3')-deoxyribonucleotidase [Phycisphaerales bacterium]
MKWLRENRNINPRLDRILGRLLKEALDHEDYSALLLAMNEPDFFRNIPKMEHAFPFLKELYTHHEIFIVTAAMEFPNSFRDKFDWLRDKFPFISPDRIIFCGDNGIIHADCMINDNPKNLASFNGLGILFSAPHNANESRFKRVENWRKLRFYMKQISWL